MALRRSTTGGSREQGVKGGFFLLVFAMGVGGNKPLGLPVCNLVWYMTRHRGLAGLGGSWLLFAIPIVLKLMSPLLGYFRGRRCFLDKCSH